MVFDLVEMGESIEYIVIYLFSLYLHYTTQGYSLLNTFNNRIMFFQRIVVAY